MSINARLTFLHPSQLKIAFTYHTFGSSSTPPLLLHLSPCIFIASFNEISCLIVFLVFRFTLALASYNFAFKIPKRDCFKCAACQLLHLKQSRFGILKAKLYEANASVKRNTRNTIKQLISLKLAMKMQGER